MDKYFKSQVSNMIVFQVNEIINTMESIIKSLKFVERDINLEVEIPNYNFKGQTVDSGIDIDFKENTYGFQYLNIKNESTISGFEKEIITRTTIGYVTTLDDKVFLFKIVNVYANPILINKNMGIRAGHYFFVRFAVEVSYALNNNISRFYEKVFDINTISKDIMKYYSDRNINFTIKPVFKSFNNDNYNLLKKLKKDGILNSRLLFKTNAENSLKYVIETKKINNRINCKGYEIIATKGEKKAISGKYAGDYVDALIITKTLYNIEYGDKVYLGETKQIYFTNIINEKKCFNRIVYNILNHYEGIPSEIVYK